MKSTAKISAIALVASLVLSAFTYRHFPGSVKSTCKDGTMEVWDTVCAQGTSKYFVYQDDSIEFPYCVTYPCKVMPTVVCAKDSSKKMCCGMNIKRLPEDAPFYLRQSAYSKLSLSQEQQEHLDEFKNKVFRQVRDTALRSSIWFDLSSIESALKNNDAISYMVGLQQLTEVWAKLDQPYSHH